MDAADFDALTRTLTAPRSRRVTVGGLAAGVLLALGLALDETTVLAKKKKKNKGNGKKKDCPKSKPTRCGDKCCKPSERCKKGKCANHCNDGVKNFGETGIDCGGTCVEDRRFLLGTCAVGQGCEVDTDCFSGACKEITPGAGAECVECGTDTACADNPGRPRCINNLCRECSRDADCPRPGQPPEQDKCIEPVDGSCPPGKPCVCAQCRNSVDCPQGQICDETGSCFGGCTSNRDCPTGVRCEIPPAGTEGTCTGTCIVSGDCNSVPNTSCCGEFSCALGGTCECCTFEHTTCVIVGTEARCQ